MPFDGLHFNPSLSTVDAMIDVLSNRNNWMRGRMKEWNGDDGWRYCILGALRDLRIGRAGPIKRAMARTIMARSPPKHYRSAKVLSVIAPSVLIMAFNDDPDITHFDMITTLYAARQEFA